LQLKIKNNLQLSLIVFVCTHGTFFYAFRIFISITGSARFDYNVPLCLMLGICWASQICDLELSPHFKHLANIPPKMIFFTLLFPLLSQFNMSIYYVTWNCPTALFNFFHCILFFCSFYWCLHVK
jgi:hypothetical protein